MNVLFNWQVYSDRSGVELAIPQVRGRFEQYRLTNQFTISKTKDSLDALQILIDVYTRYQFYQHFMCSFWVSRFTMLFEYGIEQRFPTFFRSRTPKQKKVNSQKWIGAIDKRVQFH